MQTTEVTADAFVAVVRDYLASNGDDSSPEAVEREATALVREAMERSTAAA